MSEPPWLTLARKDIGFHETGNNQGIERFIAGAHCGKLGDAWCAIGANYWFETAGVKGTRSAAAISFAHSPDFIRIDPPRVGAAAVFDRAGGHHVGFYVGEDARGLLILGGNQGDSVCIEHHTRSGLIGFFWPKEAAAAVATTGSSGGRGSWYSQFQGKFTWHDPGDKPNSNALGVPDPCQGISFYNHATLGHWFKVHVPNGVISLEQQTDIGPNPNTGRVIDISAAAAERFGYSPKNFPTDAIFRWEPIDSPAAVAGLSPRQQAAKFQQLRGTMTDTVAPDKPAEKPAQLDPSSLLTFVTRADDEARKALTLGLTVFNALHPDKPIALAGPSAGPVLDRASVMLGTTGVGIAGILQSLGVLGAPAGDMATKTGLISTLVPGLTALFGATGGWAGLGKLALKGIALFAK